MIMTAPDQNPAQPPEMPQPGPNHSIPSLQAEIERLRAENASLANNVVYFRAMFSESQEMVGSLLAQLSQNTPAPEDVTAEKDEL
jgi:hypothetical protein